MDELNPRPLGSYSAQAPSTETSSSQESPKRHSLSPQEESDALEAYERNYTDGKSFLNPHFTDCEENEEFAYNEQWDKTERAERESDPSSKRPCLTFNKVLRIGKRIVNDVKQAKFGIKFVPVDNGADPLIAEVYNVCVKKIERDNRCETIRQTGFDQALFGGFGFWRVYTDWEHEKSWDKKVIVKRIVNRRQVLFSKSSVEPDLSDCTWFIIHEVLPLVTAKSKYPGLEFKTSYGNSEFEAAWSDGEEGVIISEQFCLKYKAATLIKFSSDLVNQSALVDDATKAMWHAMSPEGYPEESVFVDELSEEKKILWAALPQVFRTRHSRKSSKKVWMWYKFAGRQIIGAQEWEGTLAPIVFCRGREVWLKGKRKWMSITTMLKDPQRLYNYYRSTQAERLTMAADAPWLVTAEHIAGYETLWKTAHTRPLRFLLYNLKHNNEELPPPQRTQPIMGDPGLDQEVARLDRELLDISGVNLATLGEPSGERTGKAILVRQRQGELINADYTEGYIEALYREGQIHLDLIPRVLKWEQAMRLLGEDNQELVTQLQQKNLLGWGNGRYDLEIEIGSVSSTAREDEKTFWTEIIQSNPQVAPLVMDKLVETLGNKSAKLLAKRFKAMMPPQVQGITETSDGTGGGENPEMTQMKQQMQEMQQQSQQQMQQMGQQMQQLDGEAKKATQEVQALKLDGTVKNRELDIKQQELELKKMDLDIKRTEMGLKYGAEKIKLEQEARRIENDERDASNASLANRTGSVQA